MTDVESDRGTGMGWRFTFLPGVCSWAAVARTETRNDFMLLLLCRFAIDFLVSPRSPDPAPSTRSTTPLPDRPDGSPAPQSPRGDVGQLEARTVPIKQMEGVIPHEDDRRRRWCAFWNLGCDGIV